MADPEDKGEWNKLLSALHCITGPLFVVYALGCKCNKFFFLNIFIMIMNDNLFTHTHFPTSMIFFVPVGGLWICDKVPLPAIVFVVASIIALLLIFTSKFETPPKYYRNYSAYLAFIIGVTWIYTVANECVSIIRVSREILFIIFVMMS